MGKMEIKYIKDFYLNNRLILFFKFFRLNVKGELSSGEHCYAADGNNVKKYRCYSFQTKRWKPVGEWIYDTVNKNELFKKISFYF